MLDVGRNVSMRALMEMKTYLPSKRPKLPAIDIRLLTCRPSTHRMMTVQTKDGPEMGHHAKHKEKQKQEKEKAKKEIKIKEDRIESRGTRDGTKKRKINDKQNQGLTMRDKRHVIK